MHPPPRLKPKQTPKPMGYQKAHLLCKVPKDLSGVWTAAHTGGVCLSLHSTAQHGRARQDRAGRGRSETNALPVHSTIQFSLQYSEQIGHCAHTCGGYLGLFRTTQHSMAQHGTAWHSTTIASNLAVTSPSPHTMPPMLGLLLLLLSAHPTILVRGCCCCSPPSCPSPPPPIDSPRRQLHQTWLVQAQGRTQCRQCWAYCCCCQPIPQCICNSCLCFLLPPPPSW
jgi:hypothetical protein